MSILACQPVLFYDIARLKRDKNDILESCHIFKTYCKRGSLDSIVKYLLKKLNIPAHTTF